MQYGDIDYMDGQKDFTLDEENFAGLPEYVEQLKAEGTRYVIILVTNMHSFPPSNLHLLFSEYFQNIRYYK